jgi:L-2-hydroxyglutarate oxidase
LKPPDPARLIFMVVDVLIIGAGVIGLSTAKALLEINPNIKLTIVDKELSLGQHASGRNSGVLHSGFYYSPDSLKARFCSEGNKELKRLCSAYGIPVKNTGKVVVTRNLNEVSQLKGLYERGIENGVDLELRDASELKNYEPLATTLDCFIWSPSTAVSDPKKVLVALQSSVKDLGGQILLGAKLSINPDENQIKVNGERISAVHVINAAGSQADRIAHLFGFGVGLSMVPFMGVYRAVSQVELPLTTLVYPVPDPINPFLGVHLTSTVDGHVKIGPTAIPLLNREQYRFFEGWNPEDIKESLTGLFAMFRGDIHNLPKLATSEIPKLFLERLVNDASTLVPRTANVKGWARMAPGIRSQLVDLKSGGLISDFLVEGDQRSTHVLNAVSPGWTASIPFGRHIAEKVLAQL